MFKTAIVFVAMMTFLLNLYRDGIRPPLKNVRKLCVSEQRVLVLCIEFSWKELLLSLHLLRVRLYSLVSTHFSLSLSPFSRRCTPCFTF
jgi:hypothetical protein